MTTAGRVIDVAQRRHPALQSTGVFRFSTSLLDSSPASIVSRLLVSPWRPALVLAVFVSLTTQSVAQTTPPPMQSALTGIVLPQGSRLDRGMLTRMAARLLMADEAKKASSVLGKFEVFKIPLPASGDVAASFVEAIRGQGWETTIISPKEPWGWVVKGEQRFMLYFTVSRRDASVFFGEVTAAAPVVASTAAPQAPVTPSPSGEVAPPLAPPPIAATESATPPLAPVNAAPPTPSGSGRYAFTTTTFDDGWVATEEANWVRGAKGDLTVLVHHTQYDLQPFNNLDEATTYVWNQLVVPRYTSITNLRVRRSFWSDGGFMGGKYFASADAVEAGSDRQRFVALFRNGNGARWLEIQTPDRATFERLLTVVYDQDGTNWNAMANLANVNRFAVTASDLPGLWASSSAAGVQYVNIYTGTSAGMAAVSQNDSYTFRSDGTYTNVYKSADGMAGSQRFYGHTYNGRYNTTNWEMTLTNRFKGATETFSVQFEAVQGGRVLHMRRGNIEELTLVRLK